MNEMNVQQLQEYLKHVIDVETDLATQEGIVAHHNAYVQRTKPQEPVTQAAEAPHYAKESIEYTSILIGCGIGAFILFMLYGFIGLPIMALAFDAGRETVQSVAVGSIFVGAIIGGIIGYIFEADSIRGSSEYNAKELSEYHEKKKQAEQRNKANQAEYQLLLQAWRNETTKSSSTLSISLAQTRTLLEKLYSADVIYPKYRTLPALTSIYEYLITGRCDSLTGPHGAYNLYEDEVRKDMVITQLSRVVENLESIKNTQYQLYQQVSQMNSTTTAIARELQQIKGCAVTMTELTALNLYYTQRNERHNRIASYCDVLEIL